MKIPYMIIVGEKEEQKREVAIRKHGEGDIGTYSIEKALSFFEKVMAESQNIVD